MSPKETTEKCDILYNVINPPKKLCIIHLFMNLTHSWLTGTNTKSFLKMSTWRVHVFTRWCRLCLWQLSAHINKNKFKQVLHHLTYINSCTDFGKFNSSVTLVYTRSWPLNILNFGVFVNLKYKVLCTKSTGLLWPTDKEGKTFLLH